MVFDGIIGAAAGAIGGIFGKKGNDNEGASNTTENRTSENPTRDNEMGGLPANLRRDVQDVVDWLHQEHKPFEDSLILQRFDENTGVTPGERERERTFNNEDMAQKIQDVVQALRDIGRNKMAGHLENIAERELENFRPANPTRRSSNTQINPDNGINISLGGPEENTNTRGLRINLGEPENDSLNLSLGERSGSGWNIKLGNGDNPTFSTGNSSINISRATDDSIFGSGNISSITRTTGTLNQDGSLARLQQTTIRPSLWS